MRIDQYGFDWVHPPPDVTLSWAPSAFHDGILRRINCDAHARTAALWFEVAYYQDFGAVPEGVLFGLELAGVAALRATTLRHFPEPFPNREPSEPYDVTQARIAEWRALGQEVSLDWDQVVEIIEERGVVVAEGALLESTDRIALQMVGNFSRTPFHGAPEVRLSIAASTVRWTRSDGVEWSVEQMHTLHESYWRAFKERAEQRP